MSRAGPARRRFATNGRQLLVVDESQTSNSSIAYASLYESDGTLLARTALPAAAVANFDVARTGDSYVVITGGYSGDVHFFRINDAGTIIAERVLQGVPPPYAMHAPAVAVAGNAEHAVVAWTTTDSSAAHVTTVSSSDDVDALQPLPLDYGAYGGNPGIQIVPTASGFLIIGNEGRRVSVVRTNAAGRLIDGEAIPIANEFLLNDAAAAGNQFAAIVSPDRYPYTSPISTVIGTVLPQRLITSSSPLVMSTAARQEQPVIASDGVDYVSAWLEHDGPNVIAKIGRVTRAGVPLDGPGVALPVPAKKVRSVSITRGAGGDALAVVSASEGTWAFRWSRTVGLVDTSPIILDRDGADYGTAVAWNGVSYLVVRARYRDLFPLAGWFVHSDGTAGAKFGIPMTLNALELVDALNPAIAWDGRQFLISIPTAYNLPCASLCPSPGAREIRLVRLSAAGSVLDKTPYRVLNAIYARLATSGSEFLLLIQGDDYYSFSAVVVHTAASGMSVSAPVMSVVDGSADNAFDVTWDGASYDVPWPGVGGWLHVWRLDRSGNIVQKLFTAVSTSYGPSVTANDAGEVAINMAEEAPPAGLSRARIYFGSELESVQPVLTAPTHAVSHVASPPAAYSYMTGCYATVTWDGDAPGFLVEESHPPLWWGLKRLPGDVHETTIYTKVGAVIRVRAYGPDSITPDGPITTIQNDPRTRSVRR
jgi:hypothetical protein